MKLLVPIKTDPTGAPKPFDKQIEMERDGENNHTKNKVHWNSNKITPGTNFMDKLTKKLNVFKQFILNDCGTFLSEVVISDSNIPGEGEHKIMHYIETLNSNTTSVVYGLDADLIMLSMLQINKIYLLRETTSYNIEQLDCPYVYCDINLLKKSVVSNIKKIRTNTLNNVLNNSGLSILIASINGCNISSIAVSSVTLPLTK